MQSDSSRVELLLEALGIDSTSFDRLVEWALSEQLVDELARSIPNDEAAPDSLRRFRDALEWRTSRRWEHEDVVALEAAVRRRRAKHYRRPIAYGEYLKLLWTVPHECAVCRRQPPEVKLHIDHVYPASLGGESLAPNLQFLCAEHNLRKSDRVEEGNPWLHLR